MADDIPEGAQAPATLWYRHDVSLKKWQFNHLDDGHVEAKLPAAKVSEQKSMWAKGEWYAEHVWLSAAVPPQVLHSAGGLSARSAAIGL